MPAQCQSCHLLVSADADKRLPPWCPSCGGDLKKNVTAPTPAPVAAVPALPSPAPVAVVDPVPSWERGPSESETRVRSYSMGPTVLTWNEPEISETSGEQALDAALGRAPNVARERQRKRSKNRMAGLLAIAAGVLLIVVIFGLNRLINIGTDGHFKIVIPVKLAGLGVVLILGGGVSLLSGYDTLAMNKKTTWAVTLGPDGISRTSDAAVCPTVMEHGLQIPWDHVVSLVYIADPLQLGSSATLEIRTRTGDLERIPVAAEVTRDQLAAVASAHGKSLEEFKMANGSLPRHE